ncbi:Sec34-like family-domain-containing protein [Naematelia encephala]|uniref:Conserved oligomeric Golgi complex subunit 3 n=1 Tax=Naematelia encephala TaxID=71784 RepID=A0A1Y2BL68_9TREE|nr:Sec34-like family-domain-containing protein [Naematelia encephala]
MSRSSTPAYNFRRAPIGNGRASQPSRSATPTLGRNTITLEEWESKAPLSDEQLGSISVVKDKLAQRPLPEKFNARAGPSNPQPIKPPNWPSHSSPISSFPSSPTPQSTSRLAPLDPLHPSSIVTPQQFHEHFTALTLSTEHEQDSLYRDHLAEIVGLREKCDNLVNLLKEGETEVGEMLRCLEYVEERSESLRGACEDLLEEQTHLLTHTSQLAHRLTFFTFLELAQRMLNNPSSTLVLSEEFLPMVKRLDECLGYLAEHNDFKDAELYLIRYQQCMTRSMTLIKIYFINTIRALGAEVGKRLADKSLSETTTMALLYTKFNSLSPTLQPLLAELEHRVALTPDELTSLLNECHSAWMSTRQSLIGGRVAEEVIRMDPTASDLVDLTRVGCSYLKQTCLDEFNLYKSFFLSGESQLYGFLETLCDYLYDHLRPRILHEPSLEVLCSVCTVLQALMVLDVDSDEQQVLDTPVSTPGSYEGSDYFGAKRPSSRRQASDSSTIMTRQDSQRKRRKPLNRLHTEVLLKMVLQDAQTRLVFRAQALLRADVEYYAPHDGDLDYPEKLSKGVNARARQMAVSLDEEDDDAPAFFSLPSAEAQESWYPTLRVTLWVLSCLYTHVKSSVFEDLAQESIILCRISLSSAAQLLSAKKPEDGNLFLVRHLLLLKEMTAGLELGQRRGERGWSGITDFLRSLLDNAGTMLGYTRVFKYSEPLTDAKADVDRSLKAACENLISICTQAAMSPLQPFLDKAANRSDLSSQDWAKPHKVMELHDQFKKGVRREVEQWEAKLMLYLQDQDTVKVLVPPAQNSIVDAYRHFHDLIRAEYDFSTAAAILTPSAVQSLLYA